MAFLKLKKICFKQIQDEIKNNNRLIQIFKRMCPYLMFLFMMVSFLTFHNSLTKENEMLQGVFVSVLVFTFGILAFFYVVTLKKKEENKDLDIKIYHLLKGR